MRHVTIATETINTTTQPAIIPPTPLPLSSFCSRVTPVGIVIIESVLFKLVIEFVAIIMLVMTAELLVMMVGVTMVTTVVSVVTVKNSKQKSLANSCYSYIWNAHKISNML